MRVVLQRVISAAVEIDDQMHASIGKGILIFVGIETNDQQEDVEWLVKKILGLRIFNDSESKMNLDISDIEGHILVISQFTLHASTKKGNRPSYIKAARPEYAVALYEYFINHLIKIAGNEVKSGIFGADMKIHIVNDGPVTIIIDTKHKE